MLDHLIIGGTVYDGLGGPGKALDVGIDRGLLRLFPRGCGAAPRGGGPAAGSTIDASGQVVCPGFIDVHSHSDISLLTLPNLHDKILQGVTTEVIGNCGISAFPVGAGKDRPVGAAPAGDARAAAAVREVLTAIAPGDFTLDWSGADQYFSVARRAGLDANVVTLVGHGTLRAAVIGPEDRPATADELAEMASLLRTCLHLGVAGLSLGLLYPPGCYADLRELTHLARVVAENGGLVTSHVRNYERELLSSLEEMLMVAADSGVRVEVSHLMAHDVQAAEAALERLGRARRDGLDVAFDQYPYERGMTSLQTLLPPWALAGGTDEMLARLTSPEARARASRDMRAGLPGWDSLVLSTGWGNVAVIEPTDHPWSGRSFAEIASMTGRTPDDCLFDLLLDCGGNGSISMKLTDETVLRTLMGSACQCFGSDGVPRLGLTHPRTFGTYARIFGTYVRQGRVLELADAVRRCTSEPARRFGLEGRGVLAEGARADVTIFDPATITDRGTYQKTFPPTGIHHVFVDGRPVVVEGRPTGAKAGRLIGPEA